MLIIRPEQTIDIPTIRAINEAAFGQNSEADIVDTLRTNCPDFLSLVAVAGDGEDVVGHIAFSAVIGKGENGLVNGLGLAPMAVSPERQRQGIGSELVKAGLAKIRQSSAAFVVVLGHPEFYPRFGFRPASQFGIASQWSDIPDEVFMAIIFDENAMTNFAGSAVYRPEFDQAV